MPPHPSPDDGPRLAALEQRLHLLLLHLAGKGVRARVPVEDLVQEVFLRAITAPGGLPPAEPGEAALFRFLQRLARNSVVDAVRASRAARRDGRTDPLSHVEWSRAVAAGGPGPATQVAGAESVARITKAFETLDPEHRRVIGLRQFEGLSARDAAARMGRSEVAVHSLYRRALAAWEAATAD